MNAIQKAIELLRGETIYHSDYGTADEVVAELEALLKQEPIGHVVNASRHPNTDSTFTNVLDSNVKIPVGLCVYADPRPPCDLKALAEEIKESVINAWGGAEGCSEYSAMRAVDIDAIITKHTGGK